MSTKNAPGNGASFEQAEAEQHRVAHTAPNGPDGISACGDTLYQHRIDCHAYKDQQPLEAHSEQGF